MTIRQTRRETGLRGHLMACSAALLTLAASPALAVVGGSADDGALRDSAVMVLGSAGNVCTGIVMAPTVVLTAAHCVTNATEHRVHYMGGDGRPVLLPVSSVSVHPGYDAGAIRARRQSIDLALVRIGSPLPARFVPARVGGDGAPPPVGTQVVLGGYGNAGRVRTDGVFKSVDLKVVAPYGPGRILLWLAPAAAGPAGACEGDSGAPVVRDGAVVAVTTWSKGAKGAPCGEMTQSVLIAPQRGWIDRTLAGWGIATIR